MKKLLIFIIALCAILPIPAFASTKTYTSKNLEETLSAENIKADLSNYKENDNQAIIYMFRGDGCSYCRSFLNYLSSIVEEYGDYFRLVSYEVWQDNNNAELLENVAKFLGKDADGVPFIVIGDKVFEGYGANYDDDIINAIKKQYDSKNSYDVMKEIEIGDTKETKEESNILVIFWNIILGSSIVGLLLYFHSEIAKLKEQIEKLEQKTQSEKKTKTKTEER